jgi:hypothetical protein
MTGRRAAALILAAAAGLFLAWQVVKTSWADALARRNPPAAARLAPDHPAVKMGLAMYEFGLNNGAVSKPAQAAALGALADYPIADDPFLLAAVSALAAGDAARGERLLLEAKRRNPRFRMARLLLLDRYLRNARVDEAAAEMSGLMTLVPQTSPVLMGELARMVMDPRTSPALRTVLHRQPELLAAVLARLASTKAPTDAILELAGPAAAHRSSDPQGWQALIVRRLVEQGDVTRASELWSTFSGTGGKGPVKGLYDPEFRGLPGFPPFNWQLGGGREGAAERSQGTLQVVYYGRAPMVLAEQLLVLPPGRYRLQLEAEGDASGEGSRLVWTLGCHGSEATLLELPLTKVGVSPSSFAAEAAVPGGCRAQWLRLRGVSAEFPTEQTATIRKLQLTGGARP